MTKFITKINGFSITQRMVGHKDTYFMAYRKNNNGADKVFTAKRLSYLENKIKKDFPIGGIAGKKERQINGGNLDRNF